MTARLIGTEGKSRDFLDGTRRDRGRDLGTKRSGLSGRLAAGGRATRGVRG